MVLPFVPVTPTIVGARSEHEERARELAEPRFQLRHREARLRRLAHALARLERTIAAPASSACCALLGAVLAVAAQRDERGARPHGAAVERQVRDRETR